LPSKSKNLLFDGNFEGKEREALIGFSGAFSKKGQALPVLFC
jgi:hypothetical protein